MSNVMIVGAAMSPFGKHMDKSLRDLSEIVVNDCIKDAGVSVKDIGMVFFANSLGGLLTGQESIRGQVALRGIAGLQGTPIVNVENACASSSTAFYLAKMAIDAGQCDVALVVGAEKMYHEDRMAPIEALKTCADKSEAAELIERINGKDESSLFMDLYSHLTREYMQKSGATREDLANIVVKNRHAGTMNPNAQFRGDVTAEQVLNSKMISDPLSIMMCSSIADGSAALLLVSEKFAKAKGLNGTRVLSCVLVSGQGDDASLPSAAQAASKKAFAQAGITAADINVVELHDAGAPAEMWLSEQIGLTLNGVEFVRSGATKLGGRVPVNPSGGLVSRGHPIGATGAAQLYELHNQLMGRCGDRQVANAKYALAENGGGWIANDAAATVVTILSR